MKYLKGLILCNLFSFSEASAGLPPARSLTIKPLTLYFTSLPFGLNRPCSRINGLPVNTYRNRTGFASSHTARNGIGYDLEVGCHITPAIEVVAELGWGMERPFKEIIVRDPIVTTYDYGFNFYKRYSHHAFVGGRYYWEAKSNCLPFVSFVFGFTHQGKTIAKTTADMNLSIPITNPWSPKMVLQGSRTLVGAGRVTVGCDFQFNKTWALAAFIGVEYRPHAHPTSFLVLGSPVTFRDNWRPLAIPMGASIKVTI